MQPTSHLPAGFRPATSAELMQVEGGPTAVEYAVQLALIIVTAIVAIVTLGTGGWKS